MANALECMCTESIDLSNRYTIEKYYENKCNKCYPHSKNINPWNAVLSILLYFLHYGYLLYDENSFKSK